MSRRTTWILVAITVVAIGIAIGLAVWANPPAPEAATPTPTPSETVETSSPTPSATPTPTTAEPSVDATCASITTVEFRNLALQGGLSAKNTTDDDIGAKPFLSFPGSTPDGAIVCRWAEDLDAPTDTIIDLAWTPLDPFLTEDAQIGLIDLGYTRTESADGALFELGVGGDAYLFTGPDVRWAMTVQDLEYIKAPDE